MLETLPQQSHGELNGGEQILKNMRAEFMGIVDDIASATVSDEESYKKLRDFIEENKKLPPGVQVADHVFAKFRKLSEASDHAYQRCCDDCKISMHKEYVVQIPTVESIRNYVGHTPKTLQCDPIFQKHFGCYLNDLKDPDCNFNQCVWQKPCDYVHQPLCLLHWVCHTCTCHPLCA